MIGALGPAGEPNSAAPDSNRGRGPEVPRGLTAAGKPDQRLGRKQRVTRASHFRQAYAQGRRWVGRFMVLWLRDAEDASLRLGVVASRKVGNAVARARAKRLLREAYRRSRYRFSGRRDVILVARQAIMGAEWEAVVSELLELAERAGLLSEVGDQRSAVSGESK